MSILDNILIEKYKKMIDLDNLLYTNNSILYKNQLNIKNNLYVSNTSNINNISLNSNLLVNNNTNNINSITVNNNLYVSSNTLFNNIYSNICNNNNNLNVNNNIYISNISLLNNKTTLLSQLFINNSSIINQGLKVYNINPINNTINFNAININIGNVGIDMSNVNFNGTLSSIITNELYVVDKLISLNANITNLSSNDIGNNGGLEILGITSTGYIRTSNDSKYYELKYPNNNSLYKLPILDSNNNLYISGSTLIYQNTTLNSSLNITNNCITNNLSNNSLLSISNNTILNNSLQINNNLYISKTSLLNNNISINSKLNLNNNFITNNLSLLSSLYISNNTRLNNVSLYSSLYISNNNIITNNTSILSLLYVSNNSILNNVSLNSSLNIINNINLLNNTTILSQLYISSNTEILNNSNILNNLNVSGNSIINNNLTLGSILNINSTIIANLPEYKDNITASNAGVPLWGFYRTGGIVKIRLDTTPPVITILGNNPIELNINSTYTDAGATAIDNMDGNIIVSSSGTVNTSISGTYYIIYSATDSYYNTSTSIRTVNVIANTIFTTYTSNIIQMSYIQGRTYSDTIIWNTNPIRLTYTYMYSAMGFTSSYLNSINFNYDSSWCFVIKTNNNNGSIIIDPYADWATNSGIWGAYNSLGGFVINSTQVYSNPSNGLGSQTINSSNYGSSYFINISYDYNSKKHKIEFTTLNGNIFMTTTNSNTYTYSIKSNPFIIWTWMSPTYYNGIFFNKIGYVDYNTFSSYFN